MDLQTRKLRLIESVLSISNARIIEKMETLIKKEEEREANRRVSIEDYNRELEEAEDEIEKGEFHTQDEVERLSGKW